ncbi:UDP-2,3-diacylglucosamine diphosphatase [Acidiferrobacter sp.]|uniref:UDP-2,3-diacylglucosamine diphosphatase n=1 Tax=Acidiferrobacter sp. TaxID=1872107 RepID=UPI00262BE4D4|nr:UDP-2,3-diacylglucosamine diphosphatase [Acidiferrobacter sp.]
MKAQAFIADLHLTAQRPQAIALFRDFLAQARDRLDHLYILGDLFEYWVGDDGVDEAEFAPVIAALRAATGTGLAISVLHGNRDFLLGERFAEMSGCRLQDDPHELTLFGIRTLISHGDALCTDDREYQALRAQFRDLRWQHQVLARPLAERIIMARALREESGRATPAKDSALLDVNTAAAGALLDRHGVRRLIHGHTHRPGEYPVPTATGPGIRIVVGDWYEGSSVLVVGPAGHALVAVADFPRAVADVMRRQGK